MAVQKSRKSHSRKNMRRSQIKMRKPQLTTDPMSGEHHLRHHMTAQGFYRGEQVLVTGKNKDSDSDSESEE